MLFNSIEFLRFFALFCGGYFMVRKNIRLRNALIIVASYVFYGSWDYRFTGLLLFTSVLDFLLAKAIGNSPSPTRRQTLLTTSIILNVGVLVVFKYFNFFQESFAVLLDSLGLKTHSSGFGWQVVLPVGISFYTFQSMGYVIDVYRRTVPACRNFLEYQAFVSFFPQLVAGPIERAAHMLPQFRRALPISAEQVESGCWLIIVGLFKKVVLADNLSPMVELAYQHSIPSAPTIFLGTLAFGWQIYCDFSGYSDIARGLARLLEFELMLNFNLPYLATSMRDFWSRWHISLSQWLRDYLYIPLGGNRRGNGRAYLNLAATMLICGLWHGASLTYLLWGLWHGIGLIVNRWYVRHQTRLPRLPRTLGWLLTMLFVFYGWMLFHASSLDQILLVNRALTNFTVPNWWLPFIRNLLVLVVPLILIELKQRRAVAMSAPVLATRWARAALQAAMLLTVIVFWEAEAPPFIYFQF